MAKHTVFCENNDGVHIEHGEFTLCGDSFDIGSSDGEECGDSKPTTKRTVTCERCIEIIEMCRGVRTSSDRTSA